MVNKPKTVSPKSSFPSKDKQTSSTKPFVKERYPFPTKRVTFMDPVVTSTTNTP